MDRLPYLLPCDLKELQRQDMSNILASQVLGGPFSAPIDPLNPPMRILDIGCGTGYWASLCHDYLKAAGCPPAEFTGVDIKNFAPDWRRKGIDFKFVQHDMRTHPWPFEDGYFDIVITTSATMMMENSPTKLMAFMGEATRALAPGGIMEIRETEFSIHRLSLKAYTRQRDVAEANEATGMSDDVYYIHSQDELAPCKNAHLLELAAWLERLLNERHFVFTPVLYLFHFPPVPGFEEGKRRTAAVPLGTPTAWEMGEAGSNMGAVQGYHRSGHRSRRNQYQLHELARQVYFDMIEALEPLLKDVCGKTEIEWDRWWSSMMSSVCSNNGCAAGESVVLGSWWIKKKSRVDSMVVFRDQTLP
jgi:SAM-dependent methyltransferase